MKKMTCKQLGGACDLIFEANSFNEMVRLSKEHGSKMFQKGDQAHIKAMKDIEELMQSQVAMQEWIEEKRRLLDALI